MPVRQPFDFFLQHDTTDVAGCENTQDRGPLQLLVAFKN